MAPVDRANLERLDWTDIGRVYQSWMRELVAENGHRIDWDLVSSCQSTDTVLLLRAHANHLNRSVVCKNPPAPMKLVMEESLDKVEWTMLLQLEVF
jgi:hypothetical protein